MKLLDDGIHRCKECSIYLTYGVTCSIQDESSKSSTCEICLTKSCCISPTVVLMPCEKNTMLGQVDNGEYTLSPDMIPFNVETNYCKHLDMQTMKCKVYVQRPVACRVDANCRLTPKIIKSMQERFLNRTVEKL